MPAPIVAVVGDNTIDRYVHPYEAEYVGGNAVNVAVQLAERGVDARYYGAIGPDREGDRIRSELVARHVDVDGLATLTGATAVTFISVDESGDRHLDEEHFGVTADYYPTAMEIASIAKADWVQIGMLPRAGELRHALRTLAPNVRIGQDCSVADGYDELTVAFQSSDPAASGTVAKTALAQGAELAVVTLGAHGSMAFGRNGIEIRQPAMRVEAVDTTGAGDSFIAGFLAAFLESGDVAAAMDSGAIWAARTCTHVAGFPQRLAAG